MCNVIGWGHYYTTISHKKVVLNMEVKLFLKAVAVKSPLIAVYYIKTE